MKRTAFAVRVAGTPRKAARSSMGPVDGRARELGLLGVGGVVAVRTDDDGVLADVGGEDELLRPLAADGPRVRLDGDGRHAAAREDALVRAEHRVVRGVEPRLVEVEGIGVFHRELAHADEAAARPLLVAELVLDLVQRRGQVAIGLRVVAEEARDHLLVRGAEHHHALAPVEHLEQRVAEEAEAPALLPDLGGLDGGQQHLLRPSSVHLLANHLLDAPLGPHAQRHVGVDARRELIDEPRAQQQVQVLGIGIGALAPRMPEQPRHSHAGESRWGAEGRQTDFRNRPRALHGTGAEAFADRQFQEVHTLDIEDAARCRDLLPAGSLLSHDYR